MEANFSADRKILRKFAFTSALLVALIFGLGLPWLRGHGWPLWPWYLSGVLFLAGFFIPSLLGPVFRAWMKFGSFMGRVNSAIILTIIFFTIFTPVGVVMRILRRDILKRQYDVKAQSYRTASDTAGKNRLERPF